MKNKKIKEIENYLLRKDYVIDIIQKEDSLIFFLVNQEEELIKEINTSLDDYNIEISTMENSVYIEFDNNLSNSKLEEIQKKLCFDLKNLDFGVKIQIGKNNLRVDYDDYFFKIEKKIYSKFGIYPDVYDAINNCYCINFEK